MTAQNPLPFRLIVVSNRGPYHLRVTQHGLKREKTIGGLVTSVLPLLEMLGGVWVASGEPKGRYPGLSGQSSFDLRYISLSPDQIEGYYHGLSNNALWPLCHYFLDQVHYDDAQWQCYEEVNQQFARAALEEAHSDDVIWVHDYHLARVPYYVRREQPSARIAFFWHIPFPSVGVFRTLPWRRPFLESLLACDWVGFHIPEYTRNFLDTVHTVLGADIEEEYVHYAGRTTRVLARPIGIDDEAVRRQAGSRRTARRVERLRQTLKEKTVILGVERMDYTKGILERLLAMERLLELKPELHGRVSLIQIAIPSRLKVQAYRRKKREIDEIVGRINGRFSDGIWMPIRYLYRSFSPAELVAYYRAADIALVTPLRDGLNLVAKEYVASRVDGDGVLILSEFAGAAYQLPEALLVNPYSTEDMVGALVQALEMSKEDQRKRMQAMQARIKTQNIAWWAQEFLDRMSSLIYPG